MTADEHIPLPGPTRRIALGPHTDSLCRPLEPGESVEVVNEGDRPAWLCVDAWTTRAALEATRQRDEAIGRAEAAEAEVARLRIACENKERYLHDYRKAADEDRAEAGRMARERDAAIAEVALWASRAGRLGAALGGLLDRVESDELTADWLQAEVAAARRLLAAGPGATGEAEGGDAR